MCICSYGDCQDWVCQLECWLHMLSLLRKRYGCGALCNNRPPLPHPNPNPADADAQGQHLQLQWDPNAPPLAQLSTIQLGKLYTSPTRLVILVRRPVLQVCMLSLSRKSSVAQLAPWHPVHTDLRHQRDLHRV